MLQGAKGSPTDQRSTDGKSAISYWPRYALSHHRELGHASYAGEDVDRHEHHAPDSKLIHSSILVDVDKTDRGVHQKIDLVEKECRMAVEGFDIAQNLFRILDLLVTQQLALHQECQCSLSVQNIAANLPIQIFFFSNVRQDCCRLLVRHLFAQDLPANPTQGLVDILERISRVFDVSAVEVEQEIETIPDVAGSRPRSPAL